jgi:hypothetical protein
MKTILTRSSAIFATGLALAGLVAAQSTNSSAADTNSTNAATVSTNATVAGGMGLASKPASEDAEAKFTALLKDATLSGRWCSIKDGQLGPDQEDKYTIQSATKLAGDAWLIKAHIQYGERDIVAPVPVQVKWAGDTPVLIVDNLAVPGGATYSARVMFYGKTYSGSWTGGARGGLLHGVVTNAKE